MGKTSNEFWSLFLFGAAIVVLSMVLEIQFIAAGKKAFGLTGEKKPTAGGAVSMANHVQQVPAAPSPEIDTQEMEALREQVNVYKNMNTILHNALNSNQGNQGNENGKPGRPKKQIAPELLNGHSKNGNGNGH
jgi:hypothetical protein